jgi:hypothetical protein
MYGHNTGKNPCLKNVLPHTSDVFLLDMICRVALGRKEQQRRMKYIGIDRAIKLTDIPMEAGIMFRCVTFECHSALYPVNTIHVCRLTF